MYVYIYIYIYIYCGAQKISVYVKNRVCVQYIRDTSLKNQ